MTPRNWGLGLPRRQRQRSAVFHAQLAVKMRRLLDVAERAVDDGQPGAPWASFSVEVTESYVRLVAELEQQKRTAAK